MDRALAARLVISDSLVESSARAGILFIDAGGEVKRSVFRRGVFAVDLEERSDPDISADNVFEENTENQVTSGRELKGAPPPSVPAL